MRKIAVIVGLAWLAACSEPATYRPTVDLRASNKTAEQYDADVKACQGRASPVGNFTRETGDWKVYGTSGDYYTMVGDMQDCMTAKGYVVLG